MCPDVIKATTLARQIMSIQSKLILQISHLATNPTTLYQSTSLKNANNQVSTKATCISVALLSLAHQALLYYSSTIY